MIGEEFDLKRWLGALQGARRATGNAPAIAPGFSGAIHVSWINNEGINNEAGANFRLTAEIIGLVSVYSQNIEIRAFKDALRQEFWSKAFSPSLIQINSQAIRILLFISGETGTPNRKRLTDIGLFEMPACDRQNQWRG